MVDKSGVSARTFDLVVESASDDGAKAIAFDDRGMPNTVASARAMSRSAIKSALVASIAKLQRRSVAQYTAASVAAADGSPSLDSMEVVWLIAEFSKPFDGPVVDVSKIPDRTSWSSTDALAGLMTKGMK